MRLLCCLLACVSLNLAASELPDAAHVSVTGYAEVTAEPDMAVINISAFEIHKDVLTAKQSLDKKVANFINQAIKMGINEKDLTAETLYTHPEYEYRKDNKRELIGYRASRNIKVDLHQLEQLSPLLDLALSQGLQQVEQIQFTLKDKSEIELAARAAAVKDAKAKANALAAAFDSQVGKVYSVQYRQRSNVPVMKMAMADMAMERGGNNSYVNGEITVRDQVQVVFLLQP